MRDMLQFVKFATEYCVTYNNTKLKCIALIYSGLSSFFYPSCGIASQPNCERSRVLLFFAGNWKHTCSVFNCCHTHLWFRTNLRVINVFIIIIIKIIIIMYLKNTPLRQTTFLWVIRWNCGQYRWLSNGGKERRIGILYEFITCIWGSTSQ